ncbi:CGNR zinc finger domain-containing protein [Streptomyces sp. NBC_01378]
MDAVATLDGDVDGVIKRCEQPTCGGLFVDTSRGGRRRGAPCRPAETR